MHVFSLICFRITPKTKIDFVKNGFLLKLPFSSGVLLLGIINFDLPNYLTRITYRLGTEVENQSILSTTYNAPTTQKQIKNKNKTHIVVKSIYIHRPAQNLKHFINKKPKIYYLMLGFVYLLIVQYNTILFLHYLCESDNLYIDLYLYYLIFS